MTTETHTCVQAQKVLDEGDLWAYVRVAQVPRHPPTTREHWQLWCDVWPLSWKPPSAADAPALAGTPPLFVMHIHHACMACMYDTYCALMWTAPPWRLSQAGTLV